MIRTLYYYCGHKKIEVHAITTLKRELPMVFRDKFFLFVHYRFKTLK